MDGGVYILGSWLLTKYRALKMETEKRKRSQLGHCTQGVTWPAVGSSVKWASQDAWMCRVKPTLVIKQIVSISEGCPVFYLNKKHRTIMLVHCWKWPISHKDFWKLCNCVKFLARLLFCSTSQIPRIIVELWKAKDLVMAFNVVCRVPNTQVLAVS